MRRFVGVDLGREPVPDETTVCRFRHLLEVHDLGQWESVVRNLAGKDRNASGFVYVDAPSAPPDQN